MPDANASRSIQREAAPTGGSREEEVRGQRDDGAHREQQAGHAADDGPALRSVLDRSLIAI